MSASAIWSIPSRVGAATLNVASDTGGIVLLCARLTARFGRGGLDRHETLRSLYRMGTLSVPVILATAAFVGALMVLQAAPFLMRVGARNWIGWGAGFATLRELAPLVIALMFNGRVGANNTAELSTMVVTEQVDALRALAIDPLSFIVLPRVIAMVVAMVILTILGDAVALLSALGASALILGVSPHAFIESMTAVLTPWDAAHGLIKSGLFGGLIAVTSCHYALSVRGGAPGVGRAVKAAVVSAATSIFIADYLSTFVLG